MRPDKVKYQGNNYYIIPADYVKYMVISLLIFIVLLSNIGNINVIIVKGNTIVLTIGTINIFNTILIIFIS